jgi:hypothetical protein
MHNIESNRMTNPRRINWQSWLGLLVLLMALAQPRSAHAGRTCEAQGLQAGDVQKALALAERTQQQLNQSGAQVVMLARVGQDLSNHGLHYSHLGFAYRDGMHWRVVHKLNLCGTDKSALYRQGLGDFFLDTPFEYEAGVVVLSPQVQARLDTLLKDDSAVRTLHNPAYNMLAYPWSQRFQQSNQWAIETLAMAMDPTVTGRLHAQAWLQDKGYEPTELHLSTMTRLGARMTQANISFDDHPIALRFSSRIRTVTVESVFDWVKRAGLGGKLQVVR